MAKARSRTAARKVKDRWKSKKWFNVQAPPAFDNVTIAETLSSDKDSLMGRVTEVSMQELTNDFRKSHLLLYFKINNIEDNKAHTHYVGHTLTSDYLRRMIRRRKSKIEGVYDVETKDGAQLRVKPLATTEKRIQNSQKRIIRESMKSTIMKTASANTLNEFISNVIEGKIGSEIYKNCKQIYPVKRIEIYKTELISKPTREIKDEKPKKKTDEKPEETKKETKEKPKKETKKKDKTEKPKEDLKEESKEEPIKEEKPKKETKAKKTTAKKTINSKTTKKETKAKKTTAKKTTKSKTTKKSTTKKTATKKKAAKKE